MRIPTTSDAVALYLVAMGQIEDALGGVEVGTTSTRRTSRALRRRLANLDLAAKLIGERPWTESDVLQHFLRGVHREIRVGPTNQRADPLYREHLYVLVLAVMAPTLAQQRDQTALVLWHATRLPASRLATLQWSDVTLNRASATLRFQQGGQQSAAAEVTIQGSGGIGCPVLALRRLRAHNPTAPGPVFSKTGKSWDVARIHRTVYILRATGEDLAQALSKIATTPHQLRDRALLVLGYGAALRTNEAIALRQRDVRALEHGLLVHPQGRARPVALPTTRGAVDDPAQVWATWQDEARSQGIGPDGPAFPIVSGSRIWTRAMKHAALNEAVQTAAERAALDGRFTFTSLRTGLIRTSLRDNANVLDVAVHSDLRSLGSVDRHDRRENLIRRSVAGRLGL